MAQCARGHDNLHYHNHDLVAISMGTVGGFKNKFKTKRLRFMLEPKCHIVTCVSKLLNIYLPKLNDMCTPKPAKLDKHIHRN